MPPFPIFMLLGMVNAVASASTANLDVGKANMSDTVAQVTNIKHEDDYPDEQLPQPAGRKTRTIQKTIINNDFFVSVYS